MKTEQRTVYIARDGRDFPTKAKCLAYERETCGSALVGLTEAQVEAARTWTDPDLAEAIEIFGAQLRKTRQDAGQLKRRPRVNGPEVNKAGDKTGPPLRGDAGPDSPGDSVNRTDSERAEVA